MACKYTNPHTGNELFFAQKLKEYYKLDDSQESSDFLDSKVSLFFSETFKDIVGDWTSQLYSDDQRFDSEGAPKLYRDGENFYVFDVNNEKYFINNQRFEGLELYPDMYSRLNELKQESSSMIVKYIFDKYKNSEDDITDLSDVEFNLTTEIENFFKEQIKEAPEAKEHFEILMKFKDDFTLEARDFLKNINLSYNEIADNEDSSYQEGLEDTGAILGKGSIEKNSKDNATSSVKLMMSLLEDTTTESDFFIGYKLLPFSKVWNDVQSELVNITKTVDANNNPIDPYTVILQKLKELGVNKPYMNSLIDALETSNDNLKTQFVQAFFNNSKYIQDSLSYNKKTNSYKLVNAAESSSKKSKLLTEVGLNFKKEFTTFNAETQQRVFDLKSYQKKILKPYLDIFKNSKEDKGAYFKLIDLLKTQVKEPTNTVNNNKVNELTKELFFNFKDLINSIGFNITEQDFYYYVLNNSEANEISPKLLVEKLQSFYNGFNFFNKAMIADVNDPEKTTNWATALLFDGNRYLNPFKGERNQMTSQKIFEEIVDVQAFFDTDLSENMFFSGDKSMWVYSLSSHLNDANNILNNDQAYVDRLLSLPFTKNSIYLNLIKDSRNKGITKDIIKIHRNNSFFDEEKATEAKDNSTTSKRDAVNRDFYEVLLGKITGNTILNTAVPADKATGLKLEVPLFVNSGIVQREGKLYFNDNVLNIFSNYFLDDLNTANEAMNHIIDNMDDEGNVDVSKMIQYKHVTADGYTFDILDASGKSIFKSPEHKGFNNIRNNINKTRQYAEQNKNKGFRFIYAGGVFKNNITPSLSPENLINSKDKDLFGLFYNSDFTPNVISSSFTKTQSTKVNYLINELLNRINDEHAAKAKEHRIFNVDGSLYTFDRTLYKQYQSEYGLNKDFLTPEENNTLFKNIISDYTVNTLISQIEFSKLYNGAINNHKNTIDYFKRVPKTYIDGKGLRLGVTEHDQVFNVTVLQDVETASPYLEQMGEVGKKFYSGNKINQADAQAYITPERWKFLLERLGQFGKTERKIYDKIKQSQQGKDVEFTSKELKKLSTKPLKGVYYSNIDNNPTYLKYSQTVLLPSLVKGTPLEGLLKQMRKQNIGEAIMNSGVKVGARLTENNTSQSILNNEKVTLNSIQLDNRFWKLQQDLPNKGFKQTLLGSQIQKNIFDNFKFNSEYTFNDKTYTSEQVYNNIHNVIGEMSSRGLAKIIEKFSIGSNNVINNWSAFSKEIADQLREEKINENIVKAVEKELTPMVVPQAKDKILSTIMSLINKATIKLKTNGGSLIQMSNFGLDQNLAENTGIEWLIDKQQLAEPRKILQENGKELVLPGQVFISGNILGQYLPEWKSYKKEDGSLDIEKLFGTNEKEGIFPKEILQMIGYRIPNQAMSSNDALQIVGILPDTYIDTIVPYTGITTKTGSDFDIDKMFIMLPAMKPIYSMKPDAYNYIYENFKGKNIGETVAKLTSFLSELQGNDELDVKGLTKALYDNLTNDELKSDLKSNTKEIVDILVKKENKDNPIVKKILENIDSKLVKVVYEKYNDEKDITSQSIGALNNRLFEMYHSILTHPDNYDNLITPIDHAHIKDYITKELFPKSNNLKDYQAVSSLYQIDMKYEFIAGKFGIGQIANQLVDSVSNQSAQEELNTYLGWGNYRTIEKTDKDGKKRIKKITVFDKKTEKGVYDETGTFKITDTLTALLNGFVDIAKDPYITRGNWNTQTTNTGAMLIRAGVDPFKVASFLSQPSLIKMVEMTSQKESVVANITEGSSALIIDELKEKYLNDLFNELNLSEEEATILKKQITSKTADRNIVLNGVVTSNKITERSTEHLKNNVLGKNDKAQFLLDQYLTLVEYDNLKPIVKDFTKSVSSSKYGESGAGKNLVEYIVQSNKTSEVVEKGLIKNFDKKFYNPELLEKGFTSLGHYHKNTEIFFNSLVNANPKIFLTASEYFKDIMNDIVSEIHKNKKYLDDVELGKILEQNFYSLIISGSDLFKLNDEKITTDNGVVSKDFLYLFTKSNKFTPVTLTDMVIGAKQEFPNNEFLKNIEITEDEGFSFIGIDGIRRKPNDFTDKIINGWKELDKEYPDLSKDLVKYAFLQSGFRYNPNQIYQYIPHEILVKNNFNNYITKISNEINEGSINPNIIKENIYRHNWNNTKIVPAISAKEFSKVYSKEGVGSIGFRVNFDSKRYSGEGSVGNNKIKIFPPFITNEGSLYKLEAYVPVEIGKQTVYEPIYFKTFKLGYKSDKGSLQEFNLFDNVEKSNIKNNNITKEAIDEINTYLNHEAFSKFIKPFEIVEKKLQLPIVNFGPNTLISQNNIVSLQEDNNVLESKAENKSQQLSLFDNLQESKVMNTLKEMFQQGLMLNKFNELGINNIEDLDSKSEDELGELLKKICK